MPMELFTLQSLSLCTQVGNVIVASEEDFDDGEELSSQIIMQIAD
jgi:hypothetical protein